MADTQERFNTNPESQRSTSDRVATAAHEAVDRFAQTAGQTEREVRDAARRTADKAKDVRDRTAQTADEGFSRVKSFVAENPLQSAGIAFAAGVILTSLIRRR